MFGLYPPDDPYFINISLFGIPLAVRWYGVIIMGGAIVAAWIATRRASRRSIDPEHIWNLLLIGLVVSIVTARLWYVAFEWPRFAGKPFLMIINPASGGIAIHGALLGALATAFVYARANRMSFAQLVDICIPTFMLAQSIGRWGNFFNQEAYGRPTQLGFGVLIDAEHRWPPYNDMQLYPPATLFHATFLYESLWNITGFGLLLLIERRLRDWLKPGDLFFFYAIWYGVGRFWIEALRTDSLCTNGIGGSCADALRTAQIVSLLLVMFGAGGLLLRHALPTGRDGKHRASHL